MPYRCWGYIILVWWASIDTKPDKEAEDKKHDLCRDNPCRDASWDVFEPPYDEKGLDSNSLGVKILDELIHATYSRLSSPAWSVQHRLLPCILMHLIDEIYYIIPTCRAENLNRPCALHKSPVSAAPSITHLKFIVCPVPSISSDTNNAI